jgi:Exocyst complex component Sec5
LLCISNLAELKGNTIPKLANLFENSFELSFTDNLKVAQTLYFHGWFQGIMEIANTIDEKLFADYTRRRAKAIKEIVKKGILNGIDWSTLEQPFGITPPLKIIPDNRCPTIRPPSSSLPRHNPCPNFLNFPRDTSTRHDRPRRIFFHRPPVLIP